MLRAFSRTPRCLNVRIRAKKTYYSYQHPGVNLRATRRRKHKDTQETLLKLSEGDQVRVWSKSEKR